MKIAEEKLGDVTLLRFSGPMKAEDQNGFKKVMVNLTSAGRFNVALDMSRVDYLDSSFLGILIWSMKNVRQRGGDLALFGLSPYVQEVFRITRLEGCFSIAKDQDEALRLFVGKGKA
jgi:anti-anti-sigma factor